MKLQPPEEHPHGLSHKELDTIFTNDKPIIFAFHGYPWLIHRLTYRRTNHGYKEEGTTTTPFDMAVMNQLDRFNDAPRIPPRITSKRPYERRRVLRNRKNPDAFTIFFSDLRGNGGKLCYYLNGALAQLER